MLFEVLRFQSWFYFHEGLLETGLPHVKLRNQVQTSLVRYLEVSASVLKTALLIE